MEGKKYTETGTDIDEVKRLNAASGPSYNEIKAAIKQVFGEQTVDEVPLKPLKENLEVDSSTYKVNEVPGNINLDGNAPN